MFFRNENGIALIWVLILLVVVGTLAAALLTSARTHTNIAVHEEGMSKAFHSAEAGVEHVWANANNGGLVLTDLEENDEDKYLTSDNIFKVSEKWLNATDIFDNSKAEDIEFRVKVVSVDNKNNKFKLSSKGRYEAGNKEYSEEIQFVLSVFTYMSTGEFDKPFNIRGEPDKKNEKADHYKLSGGDDYAEDKIKVTGFENGPYDEEEDIWSGFTDENFEDFWRAYLGPIDDFDNIGNYHYLEGEIESGDIVDGEKIADKSGQIFVIDGSFKLTGNDKLERSLFIVKDYLHVAGGGGPHINFDESLFLIFGESGKEDEGGVFLHDSGVPATEFDGFDPNLLDDISGIEGMVPKLESWEQQ